MAETVEIRVLPEQLGDASSRRLDAWLADQTGLSRAFIQSQIEAGGVRLNGDVPRKAGQAVRAGDTITAQWAKPEAPGAATPIRADLEILWEDEYLLVLNKPQGLVVHPAPSHTGATLVHHLLSHFESEGENDFEDTDRPGIVHRLDKGTSGVLLVGKKRETAEKLSALFKSREIVKTYEAIAWGKMGRSGRFDSAIGRDRKNRRKMSSRTAKSRPALTDWESAQAFTHFTHVRLFPLTGRTHQLRVHLAEGGNPIVGDPVYGSGMTAQRKRQLSQSVAEAVEALDATLLHAARLQFTHPETGQKLDLQAPRPAVFETMLDCLRKHDT
ncbi:RluA family pseudouridine synthase [bacterium]|nr:RluA family pseudouridine synthase [bacterium]